MKEKRIFSLLLLITTFSISGQIKGIVTDSITGEPICYASVIYKNTSIGVNTDEKGQFKIKDLDSLNEIEVSNLGYNSKIINKEDNLKILLFPKTNQLKEVEVYAKFDTESISIGSLNKNKCSYGNGGVNHMWGKYFFNNGVDKKFKFLKEVKFISRSNVKNSKVKLRIFTTDSIGQINNNLLEEEIIIICNKGKQLHNIDVSMFNIRFPKEGLMIAFENLIIEENKFEYKYTIEGKKGKFKGIRYQPSIMGYYGEQPQVYSIVNNKASLLINKIEHNQKNHDLSVQITLTN